MASTRSRATVALVAALGVIALSPASFAQDSKVADNAGRGEIRQHRMMDFRMDRSGDGVYRLAGIACGPGFADRLETRLDRIGKRLDLTTAQQPLFEAFRTTALAAQTEFADACAAARPGDRAELPAQPGAQPKTLDLNQLKQGADHSRDRAERPDRPDRATRGERPDLIQGIEMRLAIDKARIEAMEKILPDLKALLASLTDAQKAKLFQFGRDFGPQFRGGPAGGVDG